MKKTIAGMLCILFLFTAIGALSPILTVSANDPSLPDIFHDAPGGNEYTGEPETTPTEESLPEWTVAVISIAVIFFAMIIGVWLYHLTNKKGKKIKKKNK